MADGMLRANVHVHMHAVQMHMHVLRELRVCALRVACCVRHAQCGTTSVMLVAWLRVWLVALWRC